MDTIAAIATAPGEAGIAIVRMSGARSLAIADAVFRAPGTPPSQRPGGTFARGLVCSDASGGVRQDVDEVVLLVYRAPHSYTREDVVEVQGHGGRMSAGRILRTLLAAGARLAEPGEFTKRAFLSGRVDLVQAEAVLDLIRARSDRAAAAALEQLEGRLSRSFSEIYDEVLAGSADLEATLDFEEDELPPRVTEGVRDRLQGAAGQLEALLKTWDEGRLLREGAVAVISGRPNVGKSTLLNQLLGSERAIVTEFPGTTRDTIEEQMVLGGVPVRLVDTAGLRETTCDIERAGVARARLSVDRADLVLYVIDGSEALHTDDRDFLARADPARTVVVLNKVDVRKHLECKDIDGIESVSCSLINAEGLPALHNAIIDRLGVHPGAPPHAVISERHRSFVQLGLNELNSGIELLASGSSDAVVLAASCLRECLEALGAITGRVYSEELLDSVFGRFCLGK